MNDEEKEKLADNTTVVASDSEYSASDHPQRIATRTCPQCGLEVSTRVTVCPADGTSLAHETTAAGSQIGGKYKFICQLAEGSMGAVYKVRHELLDQEFAIKILHSHHSSERGLQRFKREANTTLALRHAGIVAVHDFGVSEHGQAFIVMDFVEGLTLQQYIAKNSRMPWPTAVDVFRQLTEAFGYAHLHGVIHRDIKPSNIIIQESLDGGFRARILDFGIARVIDAANTLTQTGETIGSPSFMSPEQCSGQTPDERSDVYSLGCTMFQALTGKLPFDGDTTLQVIYKHINEEAPRLRDACSEEFPETLEGVLKKALAKNKSDRYDSMEDFSRALSAVSPAPGPSSVPTTKMPGPTPEKKSNSLPSAVITAVSLALVSLLGWYWYSIAHPDSGDRTGSVLDNMSESERFDQWLESCKKTGVVNLALRHINRKSWDKICQLSGIVELNLDSAKFDPAWLKLMKPDKLQVLNVSNTGVSDNDLEFLKSAPLRDLIAAKSRIHGQIIAWLPPTVEKLELGGAPIDCLPPADFSKLPNLRDLNITSKVFDDKWCRSLSGMQKLKALDFSNTGITSAALSFIHARDTLSYLVLTNTAVDDSGLSYLKSFRELEYLTLTGSKVKGEGLKNLASAPLVQIYMDGTNISDPDMTYIAAIKTLVGINLSDTAIGESGLMELKYLPNLEWVYLRRCKNVTPEVLTRVKRALPRTVRFEVADAASP